jgi:hypothetical protein
MRTIRTSAIWTLAALLLASTAVPALAERDIETIVRRCLTKIENRTEETVRDMERVCARTVEVIREAKREGDRERAREAARYGGARVEQIARRGGGEILEGARRCIHYLRRHDADRRAIRLIRRAAEESADTIEGTYRRCLAVIERVLRDGER